jgi:hypothetical protein
MPMMAWLRGSFVHGDHNPFSALIEVLKPMERETDTFNDEQSQIAEEIIKKKKGLQARSTTLIFLRK